MGEAKHGFEMAKVIHEPEQLKLWTIGHSTRSTEQLGQILTSRGIKNLVDVRSFPGSRRLPHFNKENFSQFLISLDIQYHHLPSLGGRRRPQLNSRNTAWQNASFRAYADHMETQEFQDGIEELLKLARQGNTAFMCAEALWWRCHRGLIADYLKARGFEIVHLLDERKTEEHPYTSAARIVDGRLSYEGMLA
jgi:uncharacterized protein (DUF488 family)